MKTGVLQNLLKHLTVGATLKVVVFILLLMSLLGGTLLERMNQQGLEEKLELLLSSSVGAFRAWLKAEQVNMEMVATDPFLVTSINALSGTECEQSCRTGALSSLQSWLAEQISLAHGNHATYLIVSRDAGLLTSAGHAIDAGNDAILPLVDVDEILDTEGVSVQLPRSLPAVPSSSGRKLVPPLLLFAKRIPLEEAGAPAVLVLALAPERDFSHVVSLKTAYPVTIDDETDIYAFNRDGIIISDATGIDRAPHKTRILNMSLRDPGGDLTAGHVSDLPRDEQPLTRMAASATLGQSAYETGGYRNYLGQDVVGAWYWDGTMNMGIAVELPRFDAMLTTRLLQFAWLILTLLVVVYLYYLNNHWKVRALLKDEQVDSLGRKVTQRRSEDIQKLNLELELSAQQVVQSRRELEREVAEKKALHDAMHGVVDLYRRLMDVSSDGILIVRGDGRILDFNRRFAALWNLEAELSGEQAGRDDIQQKIFAGIARLLGQEIDDVELIRGWAQTAEHLGVPPYLSLRNGLNLKVFSVPLDGGDVDTEASHLILFKPTGQAKEQPEALVAMIEIYKLMCVQILARSVSHEFNNILAAVFGYGELTQRLIDSDHEASLYVQELLDATARMQKLVQGFLAFTRESPPEPAIITIAELLDGALDLSEEVLPTDVQLIKSIPFPDDQVLVGIEGVTLGLILLLFDAIRDLSNHGGVIAVSVDRVESDKLEIVFRDETPEEPDNHQIRKQQMLANLPVLDEMTEVLQSLLARDQGILTVSRDAGTSSTRKLILPRTELNDLDAFPRISEGFEKAVSGGLVMIINDPVSDVAGIHTRLHKRGYRVLATGDGIGALGLFRQRPEAFSLVIANINLKGMGGEVLAHQMLDIKPGLIVVLCDKTGGAIRSNMDLQGVYRVLPDIPDVDALNDLLQSLSLPPLS